MKLDSYLEECENYIQQEWPKILEQYKKEKTDLENVSYRINNETTYIHRVTEATTHLHIDKVTVKQLQNRKIEESNENLGEENEIEQDSDTTDSRFKQAYHNVRVIAINDSCFSYLSLIHI